MDSFKSCCLAQISIDKLKSWVEIRIDYFEKCAAKINAQKIEDKYHDKPDLFYEGELSGHIDAYYAVKEFLQGQRL